MARRWKTPDWRVDELIDALIAAFVVAVAIFTLSYFGGR